MTTTKPAKQPTTKPSEAQLQAQLWKIAWNEFPKSRRHIWAIPNGAKRSQYERTVSKATGTLAGVWDLHCFYQGKFYIFELKVGKNTLSAEQRQYGEAMEKNGAICHVIRENDVGKWREILAEIFGKPNTKQGNNPR